MPDPAQLPHICPRCDAAYSSQWAAEECAREDDLADREARRR